MSKKINEGIKKGGTNPGPTTPPPQPKPPGQQRPPNQPQQPPKQGN